MQSESNRIKQKRLFNSILNFRELNLIIIIIVIAAFLWIFTDSFSTINNLRSVGVSFAINCIVVIAMALVIISGGIDLSVGSVMALSSCLFAVLYLDGYPFILCVLASIGASLLCGLFNGFLIAKQKMPPFIVTLAMLGIARGICLIITTGTPLSLVDKLPPAFRFLGGGSIQGIPVLLIISVILVVIADTLFRKSPLLRQVYYTGSNQKAAEFSGINVDKVKILVYVFSALLCGLAGLLFVSRYSFASPVAGQGLELTVIAGCVIGGISMEGGEGTVLGAVLGVILLSVINNGLILLDVSVYWQQFISGIILITAVWLDYTRISRRNKKLNA